ncbi:hypothetical protein KAX97_07050 [candidate division WOR-3 bacterium]|nr:hypothetical protein [candidate division WOR-3 bacterium]MCK4453299.1 hypothetical protein [candidate division WOR-3 bacterium]
MGIIDKLKKGKKTESVLDSLIKEKEPKEKTEDIIQERSDDIEVREIPSTDHSPVDEVAEDAMGAAQVEAKPVQEFRTEGMHEFDIESLGASGDANIKVEYKSRVSALIDKNKIDEAINLLQELKEKLVEEK